MNYKYLLHLGQSFLKVTHKIIDKNTGKPSLYVLLMSVVIKVEKQNQKCLTL